MRTCVLLISLALAGSVQATDGFAAGHRSIPDEGEAQTRPMSWRYGLLEAAREAFDAGVAARAPGASLRFRLPRTDPAQDGNRVEIVSAGQHIALAMATKTAFALPPAGEVVDDDAVVVVNRTFRKGDNLHPNIEVRSPGLADGVRRVGDMRLACAAQMAMAKAEGFKVRAVLGAVGLFGLNICDKMEIAKFDTPSLPYDSITIEDGGHRLVIAKSTRETPQLGDKTWSDNARVSYTLAGQAVQ